MQKTFSVLMGLALLGSATPVLAQVISTEAWWAATDSTGRQIVFIQCGPNFIDPREVVVKRNVPVQVTVLAIGDLPSHQFGISDPGFPGRIPARANPNFLEFLPTSLGRSVMSCEPEGGQPDEPRIKQRKQGVLTVVQ